MLLPVLALWTDLNDFKCLYLKKKWKWNENEVTGGTSGLRYEETPTLELSVLVGLMIRIPRP